MLWRTKRDDGILAIDNIALIDAVKRYIDCDLVMAIRASPARARLLNRAANWPRPEQINNCIE